MIRPSEARKAQETLRLFRKQQKKARPKPKPVAKGQREVRERDNGFLIYLRRQPCEARHVTETGCDGPIQAAHIRYSDAKAGSVNPGMGRKNHDRHANPLCQFHHLYCQHAMNERDFWSWLGKDAYDTAAAHYSRYRAGDEGAMTSGVATAPLPEIPSYEQKQRVSRPNRPRTRK